MKISGYVLAIYVSAISTKALSDGGLKLGFAVLALLMVPALLGYLVGKSGR